MTSPKEQFLADKPKADKVRQMLDDADLKAALLAAFNQYCWTLPGSDNPQNGWNANCRRTGAKEFMEILDGMPNQPKPKTPITGSLE
jgi:hypothetical protein